MCEPAKSDPVGDLVAGAGAVVAGVATGAVTAARVAVRFACRRSSDEQLERGRWVLCWRFMLEAVAAAIVVYYLGRAAMWVFAGVAAASVVIGYFVHVELGRRGDLAPADEAESEVELRPDGRPRLEAVS